MRIKTCKTKKDFNDRFFDIQEFCKEASQDKNLPGITLNMNHKFWSSNEHSLLNMIYIQKEFRNKDGCFQLLYDKKKVIGCSGISRYKHNPDIAIICRRLYVLQRYRQPGVSRMFCPIEMKWAEKQKLKAVLIVINEYNSRITKLVHALIKHPRSSPVVSKFVYYGKRKINNCIQDVFYYKIDKDYAMPYVFD